MKKFILLLLLLASTMAYAADGDPVLEGKTATGNIISTGVFQAGTAATVPGAITLFDAGILTWWDDGDDFSVTAAVTDGTTKLRITGSIDVSAQVIAGSAVVPDSVGGATLGLATLEWTSLYLTDSGVIYGQNDQTNTLTSTATGWTTSLDLHVGGGDLELGASTIAGDIIQHDAGTTIFYDDADDTSVVLGPVADGTTTLGITGGIAASGNVEGLTLTYGGAEVYRVGGTDVAIADGGTGAGTASAAFDALSPMTTIGDLIYGGASGTGTRLAAGAITELLVGGGAAAPVWTTATGTGAPARAGSPTFTTQITTPIIDLTGGQVAFPATQAPSAGVNTLDDYKEGTYTVTITPATSGSVTLSAASDTFAYTKIGRVVHIQGRIGISGYSSPVGDLQFNLPFTSADLSDQSGSAVGSIWLEDAGMNMDDSARWLSPAVSEGSAIFRITENFDNAGYDFIDGSDVTGNFYLSISVTYFSE